MSNQTEDQEVCKHCAGTGRVPKRAAEDFPIGSKVHWKSEWWMYPKGADGVVVGHSRSGKRIRIEIPTHNYQGLPDGGKTRTFVTPKMLEPIT